jgi:hypothetical protein
MWYGSDRPNLSQHAYYDRAAYELSPIYGRKRVFLVAIQADQPAPACAGTSPLQRVHVMVVRPGERAEFDSPVSLLAALPEITPGLFPAYRVGGDLPVCPRPVQGEILWNEAGRFYEKVGPQVRLLQNLVSGPRGEILELVPSVETDSRSGAATARGWNSGAERRRPEAYENAPVEEHGTQTEERPVSRPDSSSNSTPSGYRKLLPEPGSRCLVRFGDFKQALAPQLARPERLRDSHHLPCCVQVYEVSEAQRLETLAAAVLGDAARAGQLQLWTNEAARALGLNAYLPARPRPRYLHRELAMLLPGDRVFRLRLAGDPTVDEATQAPTRPRVYPETTQAAPASADTGNNAAGGTRARRSIPERYLNPWEFKLSREEAAYDLRFEAANRGPFKALFRRLKTWLGRRNDFRRWQAFLWGKSPEEQLWGVRPPEGSLSDPAIRNWAQRTLELAGYNSASMLPEWEIFWRRKGVGQ